MPGVTGLASLPPPLQIAAHPTPARTASAVAQMVQQGMGCAPVAVARVSHPPEEVAPTMLADLHTHSTASDGLYAPAHLVEMAHAAGLTVMALTDHDSTEGVAEAQATGTRLGIEVIPGVEINTELSNGDGEAHVLGYFLRWHETAFQDELRRRRTEREARGRQMVEQLRAVGLPITWEQVLRHADGAVGRPHVAAALVEVGAATSVADAFDRYVGRGKPGYVARTPFTPSQAIALIRSAGGVAALAHPAGIPDLPHRLNELVAAGLGGLETYYGPYDDGTVERLRKLAEQHGLIPTGGSDYHGPNIHPTPLGGQPPLPEAALAALRHAAATMPHP
ncbi:MAG: PHP domain-containing protein [Ktedonobacterales bacterium]|nr:PHP domain-containing protein [Ktedonobacterales bacterium]